MSETPAKKSWPELVGTKGESAKETIEKENSDLNVVVLQDGSATTKDLRPDRVRVFVDENGLVVRAPIIG
ncbi:hypothetical protein like AT2G38870 [Hibiscus trionum]|uniref:Uncharacterized protein n=1 Tax=Hibiscus trionum TaxID=183268 RepID=A0A9W7LIV4_HIBTR|nr:hypothetical protein like AT2G38870 [Hibiscus trionum]